MCVLLNKPVAAFKGPAPKKYGIQILMRVRGQDMWMWMHLTNGAPYQWDSADKAHDVKRMYYPDSTPNHVRVALFPEGS